MSERMKTLGIDRLSIEERLALMNDILDSVAEEQRLTDAQRAELQRRIAAHKASPENVVSWEQIKADALARFQK
jgi:putative addiction module component (TIGR02574 family)